MLFFNKNIELRIKFLKFATLKAAVWNAMKLGTKNTEREQIEENNRNFLFKSGISKFPLVAHYFCASSFNFLRPSNKWIVYDLFVLKTLDLKAGAKLQQCEIKKFSRSLKSDSHLKNFLFISFNESPLKMMKNAFYFVLKALFILKIFKFLSWHFGHVAETA